METLLLMLDLLAMVYLCFWGRKRDLEERLVAKSPKERRAAG